MEPQQVLPLCVRVDLGVMTVKWYFILPRASELESHHQIQFSAIPRIVLFVVEGGFTPLQEIQSVYSKPNQQGEI